MRQHSFGYSPHTGHPVTRMVDSYGLYLESPRCNVNFHDPQNDRYPESSVGPEYNDTLITYTDPLRAEHIPYNDDDGFLPQRAQVYRAGVVVNASGNSSVLKTSASPQTTYVAQNNAHTVQNNTLSEHNSHSTQGTQNAQTNTQPAQNRNDGNVTENTLCCCKNQEKSSSSANATGHQASLWAIWCRPTILLLMLVLIASVFVLASGIMLYYHYTQQTRPSINPAPGKWKILKKNAIPSLQIPMRRFEQAQTQSSRSGRYSRRQEVKNAQPNLPVRQKIINEVTMMDQVPDSENLEEIGNVDQPNKTCHSSVQTIITWNRSQLISHEFLTEQQLRHFIGCSRKLFNFFAKTFGSSYCKINNALSMENELLIMLMKYRLNLYYCTLANFFAVDRRTITRIFVKWTKHLYKCFARINFWSISSTDNNKYKIILDCTEFYIERNSNPIIQQATYSSYYGSNTFKILVACTENAEIIFVSDAYGGSISDRKITQECGILDLIEEGQFVLVDRGFDISDFLEEKGIRLNMPPFKKGSQLSEEDIMKTRAVAHRRIIVENIIGLAKTHKILKDRVSANMWPYINQIIYNCFMICNFKKSIKCS